MCFNPLRMDARPPTSILTSKTPLDRTRTRFSYYQTKIEFTAKRRARKTRVPSAHSLFHFFVFVFVFLYLFLIFLFLFLSISFSLVHTFLFSFSYAPLMCLLLKYKIELSLLQRCLLIYIKYFEPLKQLSSKRKKLKKIIVSEKKKKIYYSTLMKKKFMRALRPQITK